MLISKLNSFSENFTGRFASLKRLKQPKKIISSKKHIIVNSNHHNTTTTEAEPIKYWSKLLNFSDILGEIAFKNGYWIKSQKNTMGKKVKEYYFKFGKDYPEEIKKYNPKNKKLISYTTYEERGINYKNLFDPKSGNIKLETYYYKNGAIADITMINPETKKVIKNTLYKPNGDIFRSRSILD